MIGERVGPYRLVETLGEGGMGTVYRAERDGQLVALKLVKTELSSPEAHARFEREARVRIDHPNVVRVIDAGVDPRGPYLALELLEGETLAERLTRGRLERDEALDVAIQACRGLGAAHAAGVVHRDLKPSNLYLCTDGAVKILDFGVARIESLGDRLTKTGQVVGTLAYLSPEQAERQKLVDHRADLWSLGAVMYECLAGRPPFAEDTALATLVAVMLGEPAPLSTFRVDVDEDVQSIVT
ncbi:MAG: serine/threonine-protein kinase, partial [Sandaracinaceae bacterium]